MCVAHSPSQYASFLFNLATVAVLLPKPQPKCEPPALEGFSPDGLAGDFVVAWTAQGEMPGASPLLSNRRAFTVQWNFRTACWRGGLNRHTTSCVPCCGLDALLHASMLSCAQLLLQPPARATGPAAAGSPCLTAPCATSPAVSSRPAVLPSVQLWGAANSRVHRHASRCKDWPAFLGPSAALSPACAPLPASTPPCPAPALLPPSPPARRQVLLHAPRLQPERGSCGLLCGGPARGLLLHGHAPQQHRPRTRARHAGLGGLARGQDAGRAAV